MAPRTRASVSSAAQPLAAAPRRRVKVTPLIATEIATKTNELAKPATRSTRSKPATTVVVDVPAPKVVAAKPKGRPKKTEPIVEEPKPAELPKRATRATRATSTTVSSEAKGKSVPKTRKVAVAQEPVQEPAPDTKPQQEKKSATKAAPRKTVTFLDVQDDKENQPLTRAAKKTAVSKPTKPTPSATGLRAKPVRKPVTTVTRSTKRSNPLTSDDEEDHKPKKIQRILTPKKITQPTRDLTPDEPSEDELNGGKTPVRDLSLSPKRPQTAEAMARLLSPAKRLDFSQSLLHSPMKSKQQNAETILMSPPKRLGFSQSFLQSPKKSADTQQNAETMLRSPARRLVVSPSKLFSHSTIESTVKVFNDVAGTLASPARRLPTSPLKLFANSTPKPQFSPRHEQNFKDIMDKFVRIPGNTPRTPATLYEHELTNIISSPGVNGSPDPLHEHDLSDRMSPPATTVAAPIATDSMPPTVSSAVCTPNLPIPRKFNLNTIVTKVPLKPEGQESPFKLDIKKRKRPLSLGGQPESRPIDIFGRSSSTKQARTSISSDAATSSRKASATTPVSETPTSNISRRTATINSARRVVSTPTSRTPLNPVVDTTTNVLNGATVYIDVRTSEGADATAIYIDLLSNLGAKVIKEWKESSSLSHVIYKDGNPKTLEKLRTASADEKNVKCIGVSWLLDCDAQRTWVDETPYLMNLTPIDHVINSVAKSARRKSMEPNMLIADGNGSIKRSRSRSRASIGARKGLMLASESTPSVSSNNNTPTTTNFNAVSEIATPLPDTTKKQAEMQKLSLTAAWKSMNASQNLGEDTPARKTLELLQRSYAAEADWDSSVLTTDSNDHDHNNHEHQDETEHENEYETVNDENEDENTPRPSHELHVVDDNTIIDTGLTPAPYRTQQQIGSAPSKITGAGAGFMSYRERVEELERREMRDGAKGVVGGQRGRDGRRVTIFGN